MGTPYSNADKAGTATAQVKVVLLAGGYGTRLSEETVERPKPMVEIGGKPILWHIMKHYAHFGHNDFVVALGYKGDYIKRWMQEYALLGGSMTVRMQTGEILRHDPESVDWNVDLVETGASTLTGGRVKRLKRWLGDSTFMLTWGDGVSNVDLDRLLAFHRAFQEGPSRQTARRDDRRKGHRAATADISRSSRGSRLRSSFSA